MAQAARQLQEAQRIRNPRRARRATGDRIAHHSRARYAGLFQFSFVLVAASVLLLGYVMLTSNLTGLSYGVNRADLQRSALQEETARLDDRLAVLSSDERLAKIAATLGMKAPQQFAVVRIPNAMPSGPHIALLARLTSLLR
jgi:cell division protein FtsL